MYLFVLIIIINYCLKEHEHEKEKEMKKLLKTEENYEGTTERRKKTSKNSMVREYWDKTSNAQHPDLYSNVKEEAEGWLPADQTRDSWVPSETGSLQWHFEVVQGLAERDAYTLSSQTHLDLD